MRVGGLRVRQRDDDQVRRPCPRRLLVSASQPSRLRAESVAIRSSVSPLTSGQCRRTSLRQHVEVRVGRKAICAEGDSGRRRGTRGTGARAWPAAGARAVNDTRVGGIVASGQNGCVDNGGWLVPTQAEHVGGAPGQASGVPRYSSRRKATNGPRRSPSRFNSSRLRQVDGDRNTNRRGREEERRVDAVGGVRAGGATGLGGRMVP